MCLCECERMGYYGNDTLFPCCSETASPFCSIHIKSRLFTAGFCRTVSWTVCTANQTYRLVPCGLLFKSIFGFNMITTHVIKFCSCTMKWCNCRILLAFTIKMYLWKKNVWEYVKKKDLQLQKLFAHVINRFQPTEKLFRSLKQLKYFSISTHRSTDTKSSNNQGLSTLNILSETIN